MTTFIYDRRDLPPLIQRALARASDPDFLGDQLTPSLRIAFLALLRRVSKTQGENFFVKRANFAALLDVSEATVYRILAQLERIGLITRLAQRRDSEGFFTVGEVTLSEACVTVLGLDGANMETLYERPTLASKNAVSQPCESLLNNQKKEQSYQNQPLAEAVLNTTESRQSKPGSIPDDLRLLETLGLSHAQVFMLMGIASKANQKLGDIVACVGKALAKRKPREIVAYLRSCVGRKLDFGWMRAAREEKAQLAAERAERNSRQKMADEAAERAENARITAEAITLKLTTEACLAAFYRAPEPVQNRLKAEYANSLTVTVMKKAWKDMEERAPLHKVPFARMWREWEQLNSDQALAA